MEYEIKNEKLAVVISSKGGEFRSVKDSAGREYLWQGDEATWTDRGPNLFPYIARLTDGTYTYEGKEYHMDIHGFLMYSEMELVSHEDTKLVLGLHSSSETKKQYPFDFSLEIQWELKGEKVEITYQVKNQGEKEMYFGIGGHPGFSLPLEEGLCFEDYELEYKYLKAILEGGLGRRPDNVLIYATSNRRHLIREKFSDKRELDDELHNNDTVQEKLSLAARFGVTIYYGSPDKRQFETIVRELAARYGLSMPEEELFAQANKWELSHGGLSGRTAAQFITHLRGKRPVEDL